MDVKERFWRKVKRAGPDDCWEWQAYRDRNGYGMFGIDRKTWYSNRAAWLLTYGPPPKGMDVCHSCDNPPCCNPSHLFIGTRQDNVLDCIRKGRNHGLGAPGSANANSKLTESDICDIRESTMRGVDLARKYQVGAQRISDIRCGRTWKHVANRNG